MAKTRGLRERRTYVVIGALALVLAACSRGLGSGAALPSPTASPSLPATLSASLPPATTDPMAAKAQSIVASFTGPSRTPKAAAFLTTTYATYAASRPDTAGMQGTPAPSDVVMLVEIEGLFGQPSCMFNPVATCYDTGIVVAFDQTLDQTLEVTYEYDPWSPDRPSPEPSVSERFAYLRHFGTPVTVQLPH